ncbi:hypothetical protein [Salinibacterium sp. ZJ77]|uniref:hypothetical protein n=1 Tax=Salinibacterium sp. ZJ77 TaxID=2708337 RepID=UPI0014219A19|nr:hypothetical protein [Salinibacterium sp. ZJ77]
MLHDLSLRGVGRGFAAVGAIGMGGVAAAGGALPAAAAATCATTTPASTLLSGGELCEIVITQSGTYSFPNSIAKLSAVLVGGGAAGVVDGPSADDWWNSYGGGGGEVTYIDDVALGVDHEVVVGAGGEWDTASEDGQSTSLGSDAAQGATDTVSGAGNSGSDMVYDVQPSEPEFKSAGGGARTAGVADHDTDVLTVGAGYFLSQIPGVDSELFPASADGGTEYGRGGVWTLASVPSSGQGAPATFDNPDGMDGVVILRYAATEDEAAVAPALAETGAEVPAAAFVGFAGIAALGLGLMAFARRARRTAAN